MYSDLGITEYQIYSVLEKVSNTEYQIYLVLEKVEILKNKYIFRVRDLNHIGVEYIFGFGKY